MITLKKTSIFKVKRNNIRFRLTPYTICVRITSSDEHNNTAKGEHMFINIEAERLRRYMSRAMMARALGINASTLDDWIRKKRPIPAQGLRALSRLFEGCSIDYLLKEKSN